MTDNRPTCKTCVFWHAPDQHEGLPPKTQGECRKTHPTTLVSNVRRWSEAYESEWCGEHPDFGEWAAKRKKP